MEQGSFITKILNWPFAFRAIMERRSGSFLGFLNRIGFWVFSVCVCYAMYRLYWRSPAEHYDLFALSSQKLWRGDNPYGQDFSPIGRWFYSPSCGLLFFGFFSFFPKLVGMSLYVWGGLALMVGAIARWCKALRLPYLGLVLGLISTQFMGAIWATKIELWSTAGMMWFALVLVQNLLKGKKYTFSSWISLLGLGMIADWKFQTLPATALMLLVFALHFNTYAYFVILGLGIAFFKGLPLMWMDYQKLSYINTVIADDIYSFSQRALFSFDSIFNFLHSSLGISVPFQTVFWIAALTGLGMALGLGRLSSRARHSAFGGIYHLVLLSLALGSGFTVLINPLSQNNAFIQAAPLVLMAVFALRALKIKNISPSITAGALGWLIITFAYSDLFSQEFRSLTLKPFGIFLLLVSSSLWVIRALNLEFGEVEALAKFAEVSGVPGSFDASSFDKRPNSGELSADEPETQTIVERKEVG